MKKKNLKRWKLFFWTRRNKKLFLLLQGLFYYAERIFLRSNSFLFFLLISLREVYCSLRFTTHVVYFPKKERMKFFSTLLELSSQLKEARRRTFCDLGWVMGRWKRQKWKNDFYIVFAFLVNSMDTLEENYFGLELL